MIRSRVSVPFSVVLLALLATGVGCRPAPELEPGPLPGVPPGVEAVRLDPEQAAILAREAREDVSVQLAQGLELSLWAPEQMLIDPIALDVDHLGRVYVTGSTRSGPLLDVRFHPTWMVQAHALRTVEDLRAFYRREMAPERSEQNSGWLPDLNGDDVHDWRDLSVQKERVYRIQDTTGDGLADVSQVMVEGFADEVSDVAGGLMVRDGDVYLGIAPDLWRLRDTDGDGVIDQRESISHGYNIHPAFNGHGVSGVTTGPDGRIYWSVGDIGLNVVDREGRRWSYPNQGAILRSEPDGSNFEVFAAGLRNIHEFAFDEFGNLISVDNDGDHPGETERVVYIVDGMDAGWRANWQYGKYTDPLNNDYKVWMDEGLYRPRFQGQAAYITPPVAAYHAGPTGLVYNPGTALSERWRDHFIISEFPGSPARARLHAFQLREEGAGFRLERDTVLATGVLATGLKFGPEGALYVADWIDGWVSKGRGRIWKLDDPAAAAAPLRAETRALLGRSFDRRSTGELRRLLGHADMRVRTKAQFELADRPAAGALLGAARQRENRLARLHGIWGLGQLARRDVRHAAPLAGLLREADPEIRAQAAKLLGDLRYAPAGDDLVPLLEDEAPRVRFFAAEALGRIGHRPAVQPLIAMLEENDDRDVYLRHAGTLALARIGEAEPIVALASHPARGLRLAAVVALRRMRHPGVARFLEDADELVVTEAARAVNDDASIEGAIPALARVLEEERFTGEALLRRAINANLRLGTEEAARRVAAYATRAGAPEALRVEAVAALGVWPEPSLLDRVDGIYRGAMRRDPAIARAAVAPRVAALLSRSTPAVKVAVAEAAGRLGLLAAAPSLLERAREDADAEVRVAALHALHVMQWERLEAAVRAGLADNDSRVRMAALSLLPRLGLPHERTAELLDAVLQRGSVTEQQSAVAALGALQSPYAHRVLGRLLEQWGAGRLAPEVQLNLLEAVEASNARVLRTRLQQLRAALPQGNAVAAFPEALRGGDAGRGRQVVFQSAAAQCTRCHTIEGEGPNVGPPLGQIGALLTREQLLEALVEPSARIAPGFGAPGAPSAMPPMGHILSRRELRDVVEYLSTLK
jgi:quinoprotein glucose dehydrogenase